MSQQSTLEKLLYMIPASGEEVSFRWSGGILQFKRPFYPVWVNAPLEPLALTMAQAHNLLGRQVHVTLSDGVSRHVAEGKLIHFSDMGEVTLLDEETGEVHHCWPLLKIEEVVDSEA